MTTFSNVRRRIAAVAAALAALAMLALNAGPASAAGANVFTSAEAELSDYQAGAHADLTTTFELERYDSGEGWWPVGGTVKDVSVELPKGLYGNPQSIPECTPEQLTNALCPIDSQVGIAYFHLGIGEESGEGRKTPIVNMPPSRGEAAVLGFRVASTFNGFISIKLRSDGDYGLTATSTNISDVEPLYGADVTIWGVPYDPSHDVDRVCSPDPTIYGCSASLDPVPFMTAPSQCGVPFTTSTAVRTWVNPGDDDWVRALSTPREVSGCDQLDFRPRITAQPSTNFADSPSGLDVDLHIPQNDDPDGLSAALLKDAVVSLPNGFTVNPSSAAGLGACSPAQVGLVTPVGQRSTRFTATPANCPNDSKLGTVEVETPVLDHPLPGAIYLASPQENPFNSLIALYIAIHDPETGIVAKLPGRVELDQQSGQLQAIFDENPQLPFENLKVRFFTGPRAALRTPMSCGTFTTTSSLVPWTTPEGASAAPSSSFEVAKGANGTGCLKSDSEAPNAPSFTAGTTDPAAGTYSPFVLKLTRPDGTQPIKRIDATLPKGLLGKLAGIPYCSDQNLAAAAAKSGKAEQASSSCPSASQIGSVNVGAGAGSQPLYVDGKAYLAGPYRGAPLSMAIITPAVAGPFDLGTVVVRNALKVDPSTAQIKALSDEIPTILQGIPLDIRSISVKLDKPSFTLNPTSCEKTEVFASATSVFDQSAEVKSPFQVGGCAALGFKPKLTFKLSGKTHRSGHPALRATLSARPGDANIGRAQVTLPKSQFLDQSHIRTICTRVQYAANACPPASIYGKATAWSPLLDQPLSGPVYLRSSSNLLPDLVAKLDGQIQIDLVGRIDSVKERLRSTFDSVPDAPVSRFVLEMQGGKKGLLVNNTELCKAKPKANVMLDGQNGQTHDFNAVVKVDCGKKKAKKAGKGKNKGGRR